MTKETARREIEALDYYLQNHTNDYSEESHMAMMIAIKALEQTELTSSYNGVKTELEPCEDCISRKAVLDTVVFECGELTGLAKEINKQLRQLPSVTPSIKEWLESFNTDSATACFTAVQQLKKEIENGCIGKE